MAYDVNTLIEKLNAFLSREDIKSGIEKDLETLVNIPSVVSAPEGIYPYGKNCARALDAALKLGEKYGFKTENYDYHCGSITYGDNEKYMGMVAHLDVVPALVDGWSSDPYTMIKKGDLLIGRGTEDDKGPFITALYTLRFLKEENIKLPFAVRIIAGSDEEVGCTDLGYYVQVQKPPFFAFTPDSEYPVCIGEKHIWGFSLNFDAPEGIEINGGTVENSVPAFANALIKNAKSVPDFKAKGITAKLTEKGLEVKAEGKNAHAAMPESGINAIGVLCDWMLKAGLTDAPCIKLIRDCCSEYDGKTLGINCSAEHFGSLTCVGSVIKTENGKIELLFNVRCPVGDNIDVDTLRNNIAKKAAEYSGKYDEKGFSEGYFKDPDDPMIKALTESCKTILGGKCEPYTMGGGTYARRLPNTVAFGACIPTMAGLNGEGKGGAHQNDEYITLTELYSAIRIFSLSIVAIGENEK